MTRWAQFKCTVSAQVKAGYGEREEQHDQRDGYGDEEESINFHSSTLNLSFIHADSSPEPSPPQTIFFFCSLSFYLSFLFLFYFPFLFSFSLFFFLFFLSLFYLNFLFIFNCLVGCTDSKNLV